MLFHKDSWMFKFQNHFRRLFGFYCCVFYGRGFCRGSAGLLPYPLPITTVGESAQGHLSPDRPAPPKKRAVEGEKVGVDLGCERMRPRDSGG